MTITSVHQPDSRTRSRDSRRTPRRLRRALLGVAALAACLSVAAPASAQPLERDGFHDVIDDVYGDFCGVSGLTVAATGTAEGNYLSNAHGRDGLVYHREFGKVDVTYTDVATHAFVRVVSSGSSHDLHVTDNGDGTLTITTFGAGNTFMYDADGNVIAHDPGMTRVQVLIDDSGTPADPTDDEFLDFLGVLLGSTGLNADFCAAQLAAYGPG